MPRNYRRKEGPFAYRKRVYGSAAKLAAHDAQKALAIAKATAKLVNVEYKSFDQLDEGNLTNLTNSLPFCLSNITQGDTAQTRDGNSVRLKSLRVNWNAVINGSGSSNQPVRSLIFIDWQNQGADPSISDVIEDVGTGSSNKMTSLPAILQDPGRFQILYDKVHNLSANANGYMQKEYYKEFNHHLKFEGTGAGAQRKGSIWMVLMTNATSNTPSATVQSRIRFLDN